MKTLFNNEDFNLNVSIDLTEDKDVLEAKLMNWLMTDCEEAFHDKEMWATGSSVDVLEKVIIFWGGNGCLGFEKVKVSEL
tara:strand:+ start:1353 stop:1592 length:240 start_codon:yes stop_codon:yes gene_type:complete